MPRFCGRGGRWLDVATVVLRSSRGCTRDAQAGGWNDSRHMGRKYAVPLLEGAAWVSSNPMEIPGNRPLALLVYGQTAHRVRRFRWHSTRPGPCDSRRVLALTSRKCGGSFRSPFGDPPLSPGLIGHPALSQHTPGNRSSNRISGSYQVSPVGSSIKMQVIQ
jgi:hypothetical protein